MEKERLYVATMATDFQETLEKYRIGVEIDHFCTASNMGGSVFPTVHEDVKRILGQGVPGFFHAPFNELHPAAIDPAALELAYRRLEEAYALAESYGIHHMVVHSGYLPYVYFKDWHLERSIEFWDRFMSNKPKHFHIYIENVLEDEPYMMAELFSNLNHRNIHSCLDTGHANCMSDIPVTEWARVLSPFIGHVHLHNNDGKHDLHRPPKDGTADLSQVMKVLELEGSKKSPVTYTLECHESLKAYEWLEENGF